MQRFENITLSRGALFSLLGALTGGYPNPDDPGEPRGPWGPVIRQVQGRLRLLGPHPEPWRAVMGPFPEPWRQITGPYPEPWRQVMLNPQPLPPRWAVASALAEVMIDQTLQLGALAQALPEEAGDSVRAHNRTTLERFVDDYCGNGIHVFPPPKHGTGPVPPDEPYPIGPLEILTVGMKFSGAAALSPELGAAAEQLIERGMQQLQG